MKKLTVKQKAYAKARKDLLAAATNYDRADKVYKKAIERVRSKESKLTREQLTEVIQTIKTKP